MDDLRDGTRRRRGRPREEERNVPVTAVEEVSRTGSASRNALQFATPKPCLAVGVPITLLAAALNADLPEPGLKPAIVAVLAPAILSLGLAASQGEQGQEQSDDDSVSAQCLSPEKRPANPRQMHARATTGV
jgi:hypothetical protein